MARQERLVGHERARADVAGSLEAVRAGSGGLVLVSGEPGIGKSALLSWLAERGGAGTRVLRGFCWEDTGAPSYWPWVQVLRASGLPREELGQAARLLDPVGGHRAPAPPDDHDPPVADDRFGLFDAVATALGRLAGDGPVVVVLDDLHWADKASLDLLSFVARACAGDAVLLLGAYRDTEASGRLRALAAMARDVPLTGLSLAEAAALVAAMPAGPLDAAVVERVWERSDGNPLFVRELARLVHSADPGQVPTRLPLGVVETVRQRLARLSTDCVRLLDVAAAAGREIEPALLVAAGAAPDRAAVRDLLEEAGRSGVVAAGEEPRFAHDLYRQAVLEAQPARLAERLHGDLARALLDAGAPGGAARVAGHLLRAGEAVQEEAVTWSQRAAREATARSGHDEACRHYRHALALAGATEPRRVGLLLELAGARARAGGSESPLEPVREAAALGRHLGDPVAVARSALVLQGLGQRTTERYAEVLELLAEAAAGLAAAEGHLALRARVEAASAVTLRHSRFGPGDPELVEVARGAVRLAEASGDAAALAAAQLALHDAIWEPGTARDRLQVAGAMAASAARAEDPERVAQAHLLRATALLELGDPAGRGELLTYADLADGLGHARGRWGALTRRATFAQLTGDVTAAAALGDQAYDLGRRIGEPDALGAFTTQRFALTAFGVPDPDAIPEVDDPMWRLLRLLRAWPHAVRGDAERARAALGDFSVVDVPVATGLEVAAVAAVVFALVGTDGQRRWTYDLLRPHAGTHVVVGGCAAYHAAVDHHLGTLAASLGDRDAARDHLRAALAMHQRLGASGWARLSREALDALAAEPGSAFVRDHDGAGWTLTHDGRTARLPDAKGLHDLAAILAARGREVHVHALLGVVDQVKPTGADPVLDDRAKAEYRAHLDRLAEEAERAEVVGDAARAAALAEERSAVVAALATAAGLGGRDRRLGADAERARKTVGARVRDSLGRIERVHPALAAHLRSSVRLGTTCSYQPPEPVTWRVDPGG